MLNSPDADAELTPDATSERRQFLRFFIFIFLLMLPVLLSIAFVNLNNLDIALASGFLHGHLYAEGISLNTIDTIPLNGHSYLPLGPLTSALEVPFVALFGADFNPMWLAFALTMLNVWLFWRLLTRLGVAGAARTWLAAFFFIGALYLPQAAGISTWNLIQVAATSMTLAALLLAEREQWLWVGLLLGCAVNARFSLILNVLYFVLRILFDKELPRPAQLRRLTLLGAGLVGPVLLLFWYNYARFGSPLETGYILSLPGSAYALATRQGGLFGLAHIPTNFYYMFLSGFAAYPNESATALQFPWIRPPARGMSILLTSPALLYVFAAPLRDRRVRAALPTVILGILGLLAYYFPGGPQYGYRYLLDVMPLLFIVLIAALKRVQDDDANPPLTSVPTLFKWLALISIILGLWGMLWFSGAYQLLLFGHPLAPPTDVSAQFWPLAS